MANSILTPTKIAKESLMEFKNGLGMGKDVYSEYSEEFAQKGAKIGSSVTIRKPNRFIVQDGATLVNQDVTEESVILTLSSQKHVAISFTSADLTLSIDEFSKRYIKPAAHALANQVDIDLHNLAKDVSNLVGTPGTTPQTSLVVLQAGQKLNEMSAPNDGDRSISMGPVMNAYMVDSFKGFFNPQGNLSEIMEKGMVAKSHLGFDRWRMAQNIYQHTVGPLGGTPLVNGATSTGASTLVTDGWTAAASSRVKAGDVFTIANVYAVNPISKVSTGALQQFVVTADGSSDGSGSLTLSISPSIYSSASGALQNVSALPADNAALTFVGTASTIYPQNLAFHRGAFALGFADLVLPGGCDIAERAVDKESGFSMRLIRQYSISTDAFPARLDVLYGKKTVNPAWACRIIG